MKVRTITLALAMLTLSVGLRAQQDPLIGTWKLNLSKSKFSPGPPLRSNTLQYEAQGDALKVIADFVTGDGVSHHEEDTPIPDGKDYPIAGGVDRDSVTMKRIDAYTAEFVGKKAGKTTLTMLRVVSKDGKTLTITGTGTNAKGQKVNNVAVFDKQ